jgi:heme/copper-type cytochrome/quinol oxidase subunit 2
MAVEWRIVSVELVMMLVMLAMVLVVLVVMLVRVWWGRGRRSRGPHVTRQQQDSPAQTQQRIA